MNFPVVGGRAYLYEQTLHQKPLAGTLNFPNNTGARRVWSAMTDNLVDRDTQTLNPDRFRLEVERAARENGVRYVVLHSDSEARPDMHDEGVRALRSVFEPMPTGVESVRGGGEDAQVEVIRLW